MPASTYREAARSGKLADPDFRRRRAEHAARARTTVDHYIDKLVDEAPQLSAEQRDRLAVALRPRSDYRGAA